MHAYVSPQPFLFTLGAMLAFDYVIFIWFCCKKGNEILWKKKKKWSKKEKKLAVKVENGNNKSKKTNKIKTKIKQKIEKWKY